MARDLTKDSSKEQSVQSGEHFAIAVLTIDEAFEQTVRETFAPIQRIKLHVVKAALSAMPDISIAGTNLMLVDLDDGDQSGLQSLEFLLTRTGNRVPVVAVMHRFDNTIARKLMQMRVADLLTKPASPAELIDACELIVKASVTDESVESQVFTFLPAVGGAGATTLAVQTAILLHNGARSKTRTCLVDLDFQHGACADYLDIEPRLNLGEIEPRPERLDRQLLEVMLSYHSSGLALIAAPNRPAEMRSFDPVMVTRLLDLVSSHFDFVVCDMPRTWFSWTDSVLVGSNKVFIVSETTVPSLRQARQFVDAIHEWLGDNAKPQVIVNRFEQKLFSPGLRRVDIERALGTEVAAFIPNNYSLVREAIDRGVPLNELKPGNNITTQLKKSILGAIVERNDGGADASPIKAGLRLFHRHAGKSQKRVENAA